jgi:hypothetical protein
MAVDPSKYQIYAEKDLNRAQIDWGTVGKTLSDGLISIAKDREARKQQIADDTVDAMNKLSEVPDVNNQTLSKMIIDGSDQSKQELQARMDLVRRGIIKPKDYKLFMNAQQNGYKSLSTIVQNYDKYYTAKMEAIEGETQSKLDAAVSKSVEQFGNLNNKVLWTNPVNGQLQLVTMEQDEDGNYTKMPDPNKNPEKFQNPNTINTIMRFNEKKKVLQDEAKKVTDTIASYIRSSVVNGVVTKTKDFRNQLIGGKTYDKWMESQVGFLTATDNDVAQILSNSGEYTFTFSKEEADKDPSKIFVDNSSGKPVLSISDKAKERAEQLAREAIDSQIDSEITKTPGFDPQRSSAADDRDKKDRGKRIMATLNNLRGAQTPEQMRLAVQELQGITGLRFQDIEEIREEVTINGQKKTITTGVNMNLDGTVIPMRFGEIDPETGEFKPTTGAEFAQANYEYLADDKASTADIALKEFGGSDKFFKDVSFDLGEGTRNLSYETKGSIEFNKPYNSGGKETSLKDQILKAYTDADEASYGIGGPGVDMNVLKNSTESAIRSAFEGQGFSVPQGFKVTDDGRDLVIEGVDKLGVPVKIKAEDIGSASTGVSALEAAVQQFISKFN